MSTDILKDGDTTIIPGEGYNRDGTYYGGYGTVEGSSGDSWGGEEDDTLVCEWPYVKKTITYTEITTVPGTPYEPGQTYIPPTANRYDINNNAGWNNSCSSSIDEIGVGQQISFKIYHDDRGFFVGLDVFGKELQPISNYRIGLRFTQNGVEILEFGEIIAVLQNSLQPDDVFHIKRYHDGSIYYQLNDDNDILSQNSFETLDHVHAYAVGYQAGDILTEASIDNLSVFINYPEEDVIEFDQIGSSYLTDSAYVEFDQIGSCELRPDAVNLDQVGHVLCDNFYNNIGDFDAKITVPRLHAEESDEGYSSLDADICVMVMNADDDYVPPRLNQLDALIGPVLSNGEAVPIETGELDANIVVPVLHAEEEEYTSLDAKITVPVLHTYQSPPGYMLLYNDISVGYEHDILHDVIIPLYMGLSISDNVQLFKDVLLELSERVEIADRFGNRERTDPSGEGIFLFDQSGTSYLADSAYVEFDQLGSAELSEIEQFDPYGPSMPYNPDHPDESVLTVFDQSGTSYLTDSAYVEFDQLGSAELLEIDQFEQEVEIFLFDQSGTSYLTDSAYVEFDQLGSAELSEIEQFDPYGPGTSYNPDYPDESVLTVFNQSGTSYLTDSAYVEFDQIGSAELLEIEQFDPYETGGPPPGTGTDPDQPLFASDKMVAIEEVCLLLDHMRFSVDDLPDHAGGTAWVMNVDTGATSIFLDYGFNSFLEIDGIAYGVSEGGIYKLQETTVPVPSSGIDYGLSNFGSPRKKRIPHFYAAVASSGKVYLRLLADGYQAEYFALSSTDYVEPNKINAGRGLNAVYWNPMVIAPEGVSVEELDSLEWEPVIFPRRI